MKRLLKRLLIGLLSVCVSASFVQAEGVLGSTANPTLSLPRAWGVSADEEGAAGNGTTDDTAAIQRAITKAGIGGTVVLSGNKTYLVSNSLTLLAGQQLDGFGATLKRAPQITTTSTASIATGGATTVTVSNAAVFAVGDSISFSVEDHAATPITNHYSAPVAIQSINTGTNTLTLANALVIGAASTGDLEAVLNGTASESSYTFLSGAVVAKVYPLLQVQAHGAVHGVTINGGWTDGGGTIQQPVAHWDLFEELLVKTSGGSSPDVTISNITVENFASEAIVELSDDPYVTAVFASRDSTSIRYLHVTIQNGAGNGIHTSGHHNDLVDGMYCYNINQYLGVGHIGGCNALSFTGQHLVVRDSYMDTAYAGLFNAERNNSSYIIFSGNIVKNMFRAGFEANGLSTNAQYGPESIIVSNNTFINCRFIVFRSAAATATGLLRGVIFEGNTVSGTQLQIDFAKEITVRNNIIRNDFVIPSSVALARAYTDTTAVVASGAVYYIGQRVFLAKSGSPMARSRELTISNVAGTTITFSAAIGVSAADNIPAGSYLYDARAVPMIETASGTVTIGDLTVTVPDASLFTVNQWMVVSSTSSGTPSLATHIRAINYVTNVLTVGVGISKTFSAVNLQFWPFGVSMHTNTPLTINASAAAFTDNYVIGGNGGLYLSGDCTGLMARGNQFFGQRTFGVQTSADTATSSELIAHNRFEPLSGFSANAWTGLTIRSAAQAMHNLVTTIHANNVGILINAGTKPVIAGNIIRGAATVPINLTSGVTTPYLAENYLSGTAGITDASTSPVYGVATVTASATTIAVTHNLGYAPNVASILVTPTLLSLSKSWWITNVTSTQFTINVDVVPGAGTATFSWKILR